MAVNKDCPEGITEIRESVWMLKSDHAVLKAFIRTEGNSFDFSNFLEVRFDRGFMEQERNFSKE